MDNDSSKQTFIAGEALEVFRRVKFSAGKVVYADATDVNAIGVTMSSPAADKPVTVRLYNDCGSFAHEADGVIAANADFYAADDGKISASGSVKVGVTKEASAADGSIIETLLLPDESDADDFSVAVEDNEDGTATATIEANSASLARVWLSDTERGAVDAAETSVAATTGAVLTSHTAHGDLECVTDGDGDLVLTLTAADGEIWVNVSIGGRVQSASATITGN